jgi:hypothetical protein
VGFPITRPAAQTEQQTFLDASASVQPQFFSVCPFVITFRFASLNPFDMWLSFAADINHFVFTTMFLYVVILLVNKKKYSFRIHF